MAETLSATLVHHLLAILINSEKSSKLVRNTLDKELWSTDSTVLSLVSVIYEYIDHYGQPPKLHIDSLIEAMNLGSGNDADAKRANLRNIINYVRSIPTVEEFVIDQLQQFHRRVVCKNAITKAHELFEEDRYDDAIELFQNASKENLSIFDSGVTFNDLLDELDNRNFVRSSDDVIALDIAALDKRGLVPTRGELYVLVAPPKKGKSHGLIYIMKQALIQNKKVVYITLELDAKKEVGLRLIQALTAFARRDLEGPQTTLVFDTDQIGFKYIQQQDKPHHLREDSASWLVRHRLTGFQHYQNLLRIKQFTELTVSGLIAYLDALESQEHFVPDAVIIDYADLMTIKNLNVLRLELSALYKALRNIGVKRNMMIVTASQTNRGGMSADLVDADDIAEDIGKIANADTVITYSQTKEERRMGLARLFVAAGRTDEDRITVLISQSYATGQFCLGSQELTSEWRPVWKEHTKLEKEKAK